MGAESEVGRYVGGMGPADPRAAVVGVPVYQVGVLEGARGFTPRCFKLVRHSSLKILDRKDTTSDENDLLAWPLLPFSLHIHVPTGLTRVKHSREEGFLGRRLNSSA